MFAPIDIGCAFSAFVGFFAAAVYRVFCRWLAGRRREREASGMSRWRGTAMD